MSSRRSSSEQNVADPRLTPGRRAALFVINDLKDKLNEMTLHDATGDPHDEGYMSAVREVWDWANAR